MTSATVCLTFDFDAMSLWIARGMVMPGLRSPREVFSNFLDDVRYLAREEGDGVCVITFHPQVIGRGHRMLGLEWFIGQLNDLGVSYARCGTVAEAFRAGAAQA